MGLVTDSNYENGEADTVDICEPLNSTVTEMLSRAREKLLDSGTRNRLIHINRKNTRAKAINIVNERTEDIFRILARDRKTMQFHPTGQDKKPEGEEKNQPSIAPVPARGDEGFDPARFTDNKLETKFGPEAQQRKLLAIFRDAKTAIEEQGVDILFLAMGFLKWVEAKSSKIEREAPLILLPVELVRNSRTGGYDIRARDDDLITNLSLQKRLKEDFGIDLPEIDPEDFDPLIYLDEVETVISEKKEWSIDHDGMQLGFFSFAKLLMRRDLDPKTWPKGQFGLMSPISDILSRQYEPDTPAIPRDKKLDEVLDPSKMLHVVEADASQARVIEEVRSGRDLVVQGPPGTGKSQTITNIIAAAVQEGKTVLFVAEKMAALSVVHDRLVKSGLRDVCLELHSRSSNKKAVLQELKRTLGEGRSVSSVGDTPKDLPGIKEKLNAWADLIHEKIEPSNISAFQILGRLSTYMGRAVKTPPKINALAAANSIQVEQIEKDLEKISTHMSTPDYFSQHPFRGAQKLNIQTIDRPRMNEELNEASKNLESLFALASKVFVLVGCDAQKTLDMVSDVSTALKLIQNIPDSDVETIHKFLEKPLSPVAISALELATKMQSARNALNSELQPIAETALLDHLRPAIQRGTNSFISRLMPKYRAAKKEFQSVLSSPSARSPQELADLFDRTLVMRELVKKVSANEALLASELGEAYRGLDTDFQKLTQCVHCANSLSDLQCKPSIELLRSLSDRKSELITTRQALQDKLERTKNSFQRVEDRLRLNLSAYGTGPKQQASIELLISIIGDMRKKPESYVEWAEIGKARQRLDDHQLTDLVNNYISGTRPEYSLIDQFRYAHAEAVWTQIKEERPAIKELMGTSRSEVVKRFSELEKQWQESAKKIVRSTHLAQLPSGAAGEMAIIRGEIGKKTRHMPIRKLMDKAGGMIQRIKPVLLMSPISVAQYLPPGRLKFDLLLIDEASQVRPEDALGTIARSKQIVVVGDQKQLPPTSFFDRITGNDEYDEDNEVDGLADATDMESILTLCEASGLRQEMLEWHYRSRDPSLITISNLEFYESGLRLPPSPLQDDPEYGLSLTRVPGVYSSQSKGSGRPGTNRIEAEAVADAMAEHARKYPDMTLGIVAFSVRQRDMITEVLELRRRDDDVLDTFLTDTNDESVFVKNIENVQGDERDVIFISVGYGPHEPNARLASMRFGPINGKGGGRRLNVLFSRARSRCRVFCSFDPGDIDTTKSSAEGVRILKRYLTYAEKGEIVEKIPTGAEADSELEVDIASVIRDLGYDVDHQVGTAGFRIDLGVRHPKRRGRYMLAVEADGATYHSALWARERDRLRQGVLEHLGWRFHRIWSTDWFQTREREIKRLKQALEAASSADSAPTPKKVAKANVVFEEEPVELGKQALLEFPEMEAERYEAFPDNKILYGHPENERPGKLTDLVVEIVKTEGPAHSMVVARRVALAYGLNSTGKRIQAATQSALRRATARKEYGLIRDGDFYFTSEQSEVIPVRNREDADNIACKPDYLPPQELRAADEKVIQENGDMPREERIQQIARLLGFKRVGAALKEAIGAAID